MNAQHQPIRTEAEAALVEQFHTVKEQLPGDQATRERAFQFIEAGGLPHRRVEEWKYTDLRAFMKDVKPLAGKPDAVALDDARQRLPAVEDVAAKLVFVNGTLVEELSHRQALPQGLEIVPYAEALTGHHPLTVELGATHAPASNTLVALNGAFATQGAVIRVAKGVKLEQPIHLAFVQNGSAHAAYHRVLLVAEEGADVTFFESHHGNGAHQNNTYVEVIVQDQATVTAIKLQAECLQTQHLATLSAKVGANALFKSVAVARGGALARQQIFVTMAGENSNLDLNGVTMVGGSRHLDTTLVVDHAVAHCNSRERFKAVLAGEARTVFQGKIIVRQDAQKTDGQMKADTLMLTEGCEADLKPELEIFADDVVCAHGATCGALNDDHLFYLKARGIPQAEAEAMLVSAFVEEVMDDVENESIRTVFGAVAKRWLEVRN